MYIFLSVNFLIHYTDDETIISEVMQSCIARLSGPHFRIIKKERDTLKQKN